MHSALNTGVYFNLCFELSLDLSDLSLHLIASSLATPSAEQVIPETAAWNSCEFFFFISNTVNTSFDLILKLGSD
jgi:hypothetical protein